MPGHLNAPLFKIGSDIHTTRSPVCGGCCWQKRSGGPRGLHDRAQTVLQKPSVNQVPSDVICGFVTRGKGVNVHRADCPNLRETVQRNGEQKIEVQWGASLALVAIG